MTSGWVYFLEDGQAIKVGYTSNLGRRINGLTGNASREIRLIGSVKGDRAVERAIHAELSAHHIKGEWFADNPAVRAVVARCLGGDLPAPAPSTRNKMGKRHASRRDPAIEAELRRICDIFFTVAPVLGIPLSDWKILEQRFGVEPGSLWPIRYGGSADTSMTRYMSMRRAAPAAIQAAIAELNAAQAFLQSLDERDARVRASIDAYEAALGAKGE
jgi:hypothetical protein